MNQSFDIFSDVDDAEFPLCDAAGLSSALASSATPATSLALSGKELRTAQRYLVKWRVTAFADRNGLHHGYLKDISIKGAAALFEQNFQNVKFIKLHIYVPPTAPSKMPCIVEVLCKVAYTIHDAKENRFRSGIQFLKFATEHDPVFIEEHLESRALTAVF